VTRATYAGGHLHLNEISREYGGCAQPFSTFTETFDGRVIDRIRTHKASESAIDPFSQREAPIRRYKNVTGETKKNIYICFLLQYLSYLEIPKGCKYLNLYIEKKILKLLKLFHNYCIKIFSS